MSDTACFYWRLISKLAGGTTAKPSGLIECLPAVSAAGPLAIKYLRPGRPVQSISLPSCIACESGHCAGPLGLTHSLDPTPVVYTTGRHSADPSGLAVIACAANCNRSIPQTPTPRTSPRITSRDPSRDGHKVFAVDRLGNWGRNQRSRPGPGFAGHLDRSARSSAVPTVVA